jgi:hypothetical protein
MPNARAASQPPVLAKPYPPPIKPVPHPISLCRRRSGEFFPKSSAKLVGREEGGRRREKQKGRGRRSRCQGGRPPGAVAACDTGDVAASVSPDPRLNAAPLSPGAVTIVLNYESTSSWCPSSPSSLWTCRAAPRHRADHIFTTSTAQELCTFAASSPTSRRVVAVSEEPHHAKDAVAVGRGRGHL